MVLLKKSMVKRTADLEEVVVVYIVVSFLALLALAVGRNPYFCFLRFCFPQSLWPYYTVEPIHYNGIGSKEKRIIYDLFSLALGGG